MLKQTILTGRWSRRFPSGHLHHDPRSSPKPSPITSRTLTTHSSQLRSPSILLSASNRYYPNCSRVITSHGPTPSHPRLAVLPGDCTSTISRNGSRLVLLFTSLSPLLPLRKHITCDANKGNMSLVPSIVRSCLTRKQHRSLQQVIRSVPPNLRPLTRAIFSTNY